MNRLLMILLLCLASYPIFGQEKVCGSVEQYAKGGRASEWKNLPGCTGDTGNSDPVLAGQSRAKEACQRYME